MSYVNKAIHNVTFLKALQISLYSTFKMELFAKKLWLLVVKYFFYILNTWQVLSMPLLV